MNVDQVGEQLLQLHGFSHAESGESLQSGESGDFRVWTLESGVWTLETHQRKRNFYCVPVVLPLAVVGEGGPPGGVPLVG